MKNLLKRSLTIAVVIVMLCTTMVFASAVEDLDPPLWEQFGYGSMNEMIGDYRLASVEEYYMFVQAIRDGNEMNFVTSLFDSTRGTPQITSVMFDGDYVDFDGSEPVNDNGVVMIPGRALFEAFGGDVAFDNGEITIELGGKTIGLTIGTAEISITEGDDVQVKEISRAPYISAQGKTYLPVRAVCEALGFDVYWDDWAETVVIIDTESLIAEIDAKFMTANEFLSGLTMPEARTGAYKTTMDMAVNITMLDSINGDKTMKLSANSTMIMDGYNFSMTCKTDINALADMIFAAYSVIDSEAGEEIARIKELLKNAAFDMIFNYDEGKMYITSPLLGELFDGFTANTWLEIDGISEYIDMAQAEGNPFEGLTVGTLIYSGAMSSYGGVDCYLYDAIISQAESLAGFLGDGKLTKKGNDYSINLTMDDLSEMLGKDAEEAITEFDTSITVKTDKGAITGATGEMNLRTQDYFGAMMITGGFNINSDVADFDFELHVKNSMKIVAAIRSKVVKSAQSPLSAPPDGAMIVRMEDLF